MREKVFSIKENYDKKFDELFMQFKNIESLFLQGYFEQETLGDIKNSKQKQREIVKEIQEVLMQLEDLAQKVQALKSSKGTAQPQDFFFSYETIRGALDAISKQLVSEEREMRKLSCRISDYQRRRLH